MRDLKFRIIVLESLRRSMTAVERQLPALGGATKLDGDIEAVRAHSIERDVFEIEFGKNVAAVGGTLLPEADQELLKR